MTFVSMGLTLHAIEGGNKINKWKAKRNINSFCFGMRKRELTGINMAARVLKESYKWYLNLESNK